MRQIRDFRPYLVNIFHDCRETLERQSKDLREDVARPSHKCSSVSLLLARQSRHIRENVSRHSHECRLVLFSRQIVASCLHVFSRLPRDCRTTFVRVSRNCRITNLPTFSGDRIATLARTSYDSLATGSQIFWRKKNRTKILNRF